MEYVFYCDIDIQLYIQDNGHDLEHSSNKSMLVTGRSDDLKTHLFMNTV